MLRAEAGDEFAAGHQLGARFAAGEVLDLQPAHDDLGSAPQGVIIGRQLQCRIKIRLNYTCPIDQLACRALPCCNDRNSSKRRPSGHHQLCSPLAAGRLPPRCCPRQPGSRPRPQMSPAMSINVAVASEGRLAESAPVQRLSQCLLRNCCCATVPNCQDHLWLRLLLRKELLCRGVQLCWRLRLEELTDASAIDLLVPADCKRPGLTAVNRTQSLPQHQTGKLVSIGAASEESVSQQMEAVKTARATHLLESNSSVMTSTLCRRVCMTASARAYVTFSSCCTSGSNVGSRPCQAQHQLLSGGR